MNVTQSHAALARRDFMRLATLAGIGAVGGGGLIALAPWLNLEASASRTRRPLATAAAPESARMREIVRYATLAASGHNTQPWRFAIRPGTIEIRPDPGRRLPIVDPADREMWISLGCALENLRIAARASGYATEVDYPGVSDAIRVRLTPGTAAGGPLFDAIPARQNTRSHYDGTSISREILDRLQSMPLEPGIALRFTTTRGDLAIVEEYVRLGNLRQYADRAFVRELVHWVRFNRREALTSLDGLSTRSTGNPDVPRWLGRLIVSGTGPRQQADADAAKLRSSAGAFVVTSESEDKAAWVRTGQVYERIALTMTSYDVRSAFLNQPIEVPGVREQFRSALALGTARPQLLVRFGHAPPMPRSLRRSLHDVLA